MVLLTNTKVGVKLGLLIGVSIIGFMTLLLIAQTTLKDNLILEKQRRLKAVVESTISQVSELERTLPRQEAQEKAKKLFESARFDNGNYVFVTDHNGINIAHPIRKDLLGVRTPILDIIPKSKEPGGGIVFYVLTSKTGVDVRKMSYVVAYKPWHWIVGSGMPLEEVEEAISKQSIRLGSTSLGITAFIGLVGFLIVKTITKPLTDIRSAMEQVAQGDLTVSIPKHGNDEIGLVATAANTTIESLRHALNESVISAQEVSSASMRIANSAEQTSHSITKQHEQLMQLATAMTEMSTTVASVADHAENTAQDVEQTTHEVNQGNENVSATITSIQSLSKEIENAAEQVKFLNEGVSAIGDVTAVITGISEQTNLLALNAAIEAARAGEQGRGFAVVADEVRTLASRTNASTEEIQKTIERLQKFAQATTSAMEKSQSLVYDSVHRAESCGQDLQTIVQHIMHISDKSAQIATSAEEQTAVAEDMNRNISGVNDAAQTVSIASGDLAKESELLATMSHQLDNKLSSFKI